MAFIILDRDGVINYDSDEYIKSPDEWLPIPGSLDAIAQLNRAGFRVLVATNQSAVARGLINIDMLDSIHEKMMRSLASVGGYVDEIFSARTILMMRALAVNQNQVYCILWQQNIRCILTKRFLLVIPLVILGLRKPSVVYQSWFYPGMASVPWKVILI